MTLGFSVNDLLPKARGGGQLKMGLVKLSEEDWLQPQVDLKSRRAGFAAHPDGIASTAEAESAGCELARILGIEGGLAEAALTHHEDMCLLTRSPDEQQYRLAGAAVAWPSDWGPKEKIGLPLRALHQPIQGYEEQLATPVDAFMEKLKPGAIYGRANWFIAHTPQMHWIQGESAAQDFADVTAQNAGETLFVRSERQTLRRLPETGAILFTIGIYVEALAALSPDNQVMLSAAMDTLLAGEGDRRGAPYYAEQLQAYVRAQQ